MIYHHHMYHYWSSKFVRLNIDVGFCVDDDWTRKNDVSDFSGCGFSASNQSPTDSEEKISTLASDISIYLIPKMAIWTMMIIRFMGARFSDKSPVEKRWSVEMTSHQPDFHSGPVSNKHGQKIPILNYTYNPVVIRSDNCKSTIHMYNIYMGIIYIYISIYTVVDFRIKSLHW